jgi:hypothetical protein
MGWALLFLALVFGPIVWAFTKGRGVRDVTEDHDGSTGYGDLIKHSSLQGGPGGGGSSGGASG